MTAIMMVGGFEGCVCVCVEGGGGGVADTA